MPIFEFICTECGENFETVVLDGEAIKCPNCGNKNIIKQLSNFAIMSYPSSCFCENSCLTDARHKHKCCRNCYH
jgi:putative FmdB family regulatory protein